MRYYINNENVPQATFQESMTESIQDLNEYEIELIQDQMLYHINLDIIINDFTYRIESEEGENKMKYDRYELENAFTYECDDNERNTIINHLESLASVQDQDDYIALLDIPVYRK